MVAQETQTKATEDAHEASLRLRHLGYRITPQRMVILEAIMGSPDHVTAEEIHCRIRARYPEANISTVYRTLELLERLGMVTETDLGEGKVQYHVAERARHHHLICQRCGRMEALDDSLLRPLKSAILEQHRFQAQMRHFAIFGLCQECQGTAG